MQKLFFLLLLLSGISCGNLDAQSAAINADDFEKILHSGQAVQLVDVRTPGEFAAGYIGGAVNHNIYDADFAQKMALLDKKKPIMVYCAVGGRSASAAEQLKKLGFEKIFDLAGGIKSWKNAGKKVVK
jgi:rhodanese-related sulfurtransferase